MDNGWALKYVKDIDTLIQYIKENDPPLLIGINKELDQLVEEALK